MTPGYIDTGMFDGVAPPRLTPMLPAEQVARASVDAVKTNRILVRAPFMVHLLPFFRGLLPARLFDRLIGRGFRIYGSMDTFRGR